MEQEAKYQLTLTMKQLKVVEEALDLYTRVGMGQTEIVKETLFNLFYSDFKKITHEQWDKIKQLCDEIKNVLFDFASGQSYGIANKEVNDKAKIAYDLDKTIQKQIAADDNHRQISVWHHGNILHLGSEILAKIEKIL